MQDFQQYKITSFKGIVTDDEAEIYLGILELIFLQHNNDLVFPHH